MYIRLVIFATVFGVVLAKLAPTSETTDSAQLSPFMQPDVIVHRMLIATQSLVAL